MPRLICLVLTFVMIGCEGGVQIFNWDEPDPTTVLIVNEPEGAFKIITVVVYQKTCGDYELFARFNLDALDKKKLVMPLDTIYRVEASFKQEYSGGKYLYTDVVEGKIDNYLDSYQNSQYGEVIVFFPNPRYWRYQAIK